MSSGSGIPPTHETLALVDELRKNNSKYVFALFKIEGNQVIPDVAWPSSDDDQKLIAVLKKEGDAAVARAFEKSIWPAFLSAIEQANGPRFVVIDFSHLSADGRTIRTLTSIGYCPDKGTSAKSKMAFASTKTSFEAKINIGKKYPANDLSDLEYPLVYDAIRKA